MAESHLGSLLCWAMVFEGRYCRELSILLTARQSG